MQEIHVEKPPLSKKRSYVLRTSLLQAAVAAVRVGCHIDIKYFTPKVDGSILESEYWLPNENVPYPRAYVRAGSLPREERAEAVRALKVLPAFAQWLAKVVSLPANSPILIRGPKFTATYRHGLVDIRHDFI
jgi:hypothetical protein